MRTAMAVLTGPAAPGIRGAYEMLCSANGDHDAHPKAEVMTALGNNVHIFARPHRRQDLIWCFDTVLGCGRSIRFNIPG
jgi:hypothetical protein